MRNTWIYRETRALLHSSYSSVFRVGFRVFRVGFRVFRVGFRVFRMGFRVFRVGFRVFRVGSGCSGGVPAFTDTPSVGFFSCQNIVHARNIQYDNVNVQYDSANSTAARKLLTMKTYSQEISFHLACRTFWSSYILECHIIYLNCLQ
jgi:hypothetical protein